ncbi:hypothetical protein [Brevundimonas sp. SORGH_AS_0993]|uniref:hypothetical protein n=1 Tax=Brevundimonas sp. SORGH_AS_0993 TaxID=3041794 RepID=UPI0027894FCF|nr:hypothetical protein [Brevundimonas sp. SORGH_AS_0993]MDQ1153958.1 hypothetical protein [Brevundimonas sp. SORGH_AS_0993]
MLKTLLGGVAALSLIGASSAGFAQEPEGPVVTGARPAETADALKVREAIAYSNPLPRGAPTADYPLVAWCDALVTGHADLGETLTNPAPEDTELVRLGRLEAQDFRSALAAATPRQSAASKAEAARAVAAVKAQWAPLLASQDEAARSQSFGLFYGLPGRCEHAARRIRENITTPPATPAEVGLEAPAAASATAN